MNYKKGVTITSLVVYVILLFALTTFSVVISNNLNGRLFSERGLSINMTGFNKLQYNLFNSSIKSKKASVFSKEISFSNGDVYTYDEINKLIKKNNSTLINNVIDFETESISNSRGNLIKITIELNKYLNKVKKEIKFFVEE